MRVPARPSKAAMLFWRHRPRLREAARSSASTLEILPKAQAVPVVVFDLEVAATILLVADVSYDLHPFRLVLCIQCIGVVDPDIRVPCSPFPIEAVVGVHVARRVDLTQHDDDAVALGHTE